MSFGIERQSEQYGAFVDDPGVYARRDHVAIYDVPDGVPEYLAGRGITAGLLNHRQAFGPEGDPRDLYGDGMGEDPRGYYEGDPHGYDHLVPPRRDPESEPNPHAPLPVQPLDQFQEQHHPDDFANYHNPAPPSFNEARRLTADDGPASGDMNGGGALFTPGLYSPEKTLDWRSSLLGQQPEQWITALAVPPAQPAPPAAPVWLGHTYAPGHRVGLPWRDQTLPGTVTHLEGYNVGVRWDDGQHSIEEAHNIQPLHQWR